MSLRHTFNLLPEDKQFLEEYGLPWEAVEDGSQWVLIHDFRIPQGYNIATATAAIRLETGYPFSQLDMVYFFPALSRADGRIFNKTEATQTIDGKTYQRWSRHRTAENPWTPGEDNLGSHVLLIEDWLAREVM